MDKTPNIPTNQDWHRLWSQLIDAPIGGEHSAFARYCKGMLELVDRNAITRQVAALSIAKVYAIPRYDDSGQREAIMQLALQLEIPANMSETAWHELHDLIEAL